MNDNAKSVGALALVTSGIGAAFALAACCALPILLTGVGLSVYWLAPVAEIGERFNVVLTVLAVFALGGAVVTVLRASKTCSPGDLCSRPIFRAGVIVLACIGVVLLVLSKTYG